jgi:uncharacterized protein
MSEKGIPTPSSTEDEWFAKEDAEKKRKLALQQKRALAEAEQKRLKELHWMHCPKCGMQMQEVRYQELTVEVCFSCGGAFLDQGDMDRIAHPQQKGIMAAILNWFKDEAKAPK